MMKRDQALQILAEHMGDTIVVPVFQSAFDWMNIRPHPLNYLCVGAMGQASSHALGLALAMPNEKIVVLDGDGSLLMNLGSLVTIGSRRPKNLTHFVSHNGIYEVNGRYPDEMLQKPFEAEHLLGACMLLRRDALDQVGLFDSTFFMYYEETDFCLRAARAGLSTPPPAELGVRSPEELGERLLAVVTAAEQRGLDAEDALREAVRRYAGELDAEAAARSVP